MLAMPVFIKGVALPRLLLGNAGVHVGIPAAIGIR